MTDSFRYLASVTGVSRYQSMVRARALRAASTFGSQPSTRPASVMSGRRRVGSSTGQRLEHRSRRRPGDLEHQLGELERS